MVYSAVRERDRRPAEAARAARPARWSRPAPSSRSTTAATCSTGRGRRSAARRRPSACSRDPNVSRRHAELRRADSGDWTIVDLGSTNGIKVNGRRVASTRLSPGDQVTVGHDDLPVRHRAVAAAGRKVLARGLRPDLRRPQVRLPRRPLPLPALDRAQRAQGPARAPSRRRPTRPASTAARLRRRRRAAATPG